MHERGSTMSSDGPPAFELSHDVQGRLVLIDADGERHVDVSPVRAFPLTEPQRWISLCDAHGRELLSIPSPDELPAETRGVIEAELARREFVPLIRRIVNVTLNAEPSEWTVETDRGATKFRTEGADAVRRTGPDRCLITDVFGMRYLIVDRKQLDAASRRLLEQYF
jgi:hypothetical protein